MDLTNFIQSDDFGLYRQELMNEMAIYMSKMLYSSDVNDMLQIKGALEIVQKIIHLPEKLMPDKEEKTNENKRIDRDFKQFQASFVTQSLKRS